MLVGGYVVQQVVVVRLEDLLEGEGLLEVLVDLSDLGMQLLALFFQQPDPCLDLNVTRLCLPHLDLVRLTDLLLLFLHLHQTRLELLLPLFQGPQLLVLIH